MIESAPEAAARWPDLARRPRVLFLVKQLALGGAERTIVTLAGQLRDTFDVTVGYFFGHDALRADLERIGVPLIEISGTAPALPALARLRRALWRLKPDVVNAHDPYSAILARVAAATSRTPVVTTLQLVASVFRPRTIAADRITSALLGSGTIAISREVERDWLDSRLGPLLARRQPRAVIANPVDDAAAGAAAGIDRAAVRRGLDLDPSHAVIANVGRFVEQKGQDWLVQAFALLAPRHPELRLVLVGYGALEPELRRSARQLGVEERVVFAVHRHDALEIVAASDVFAFPSRFEGLGVAALEAMWIGIPVVANDIPPMTEFIRDGETGLLAPASDPAALADAIERVVVDRALAERLARRAREEIRRRFSAQAVAAEYQRFLSGVM
jgi:glycosyltransferase involved in cell wall biosynthesis